MKILAASSSRSGKKRKKKAGGPEPYPFHFQPTTKHISLSLHFRNCERRTEMKMMKMQLIPDGLRLLWDLFSFLGSSTGSSNNSHFYFAAPTGI